MCVSIFTSQDPLSCQNWFLTDFVHFHICLYVIRVITSLPTCEMKECGMYVAYIFLSMNIYFLTFIVCRLSLRTIFKSIIIICERETSETRTKARSAGLIWLRIYLFKERKWEYYNITSWNVNIDHHANNLLDPLTFVTLAKKKFFFRIISNLRVYK